MLLAVLSETSALNDCTRAIVLSPERYKSQSRKLGFDHRLVLEWELYTLAARAYLVWQDGVRISDEIMPNISQFPAIAASSKAVRSAETPFRLETVRRTVLKLVNPLASQQPSVPTISEEALAAMQRLVGIIHTLRSSQPVFLEGASFQASSTLETLLPYVSEEAYDVMDALRLQQAAISGQRTASKGQEPCLYPSTPPPLHPSTPPLLTIDTLIPSLLWQIARSDYSLMHLIEGVRGRCWQAQGWTAGMVRLVVMLELEAPTVCWCFDLATGHAAKGLLESIAIIQTDEPVLPLQQARTKNGRGDDACQVKRQLQAIVQQLQFEAVGLRDILQGITVDLLQPGSNWQTGTLRLRFGFEFSAQPLDYCKEPPEPSEPIEAELVEDGVAIAHAIASTQVSVLPMFERSLSPATLVRAHEAARLERYTRQTARQQIIQSLCHLQQQQDSHVESEQLTMIVQAALNVFARNTRSTGIGLLQPTLLLDELAPKLLWSLARCTYDIMQLLGGLPAQVLQPGASWEQGTLRLLAVLHLRATNQDYTLELSTGRSVTVNVAPLAKGAIVQLSATALCQQPTSIETLTAYLQAQWDEIPAYTLLSNGLAVDWLEDVDQDWQTGTMTLKLHLVFFPDSV